MRGVVLGIVFASTLYGAVPPQKKGPTEELLQSLFEGIKHTSPYVHFYRFLDLEALFEDYPELENQYKGLSPEEKKSLLATVEEFNQVLADIVTSLSCEEPLNESA